MAGNTSDVFPKKFCLRDGVERLKIVAWARIPEQSMKAKTKAIYNGNFENNKHSTL